MLIEEFMTPNPVTVGEEISIIEAAELMKEKNIRRLPVLRKGELVGIVTDGDLRSAAPSQVISFDAYERELMPELHKMLSNVRLKEIMSRKVITVEPEQTIALAALRMLHNRISGMPVMNSHGQLVGIITEGDIFKSMVTFSGIQFGKTLLGLRLSNRPGSIKRVADVVREHDGRLISIMTSFDPRDSEFRRVYIRIKDLAPDKLAKMESSLQEKFELLYVIQDEADTA